MNCQLCQYRAQILVHGHNVGAPQEGHHHVFGAGIEADGHMLDHHHSHSHK